MTKIKFKHLPLQDALLLFPFRTIDRRGDFVKIADSELLKNLDFKVRDVFYSTNKKNVIRGLHFQNPNPQAKLVFCTKGSVFDVIVDLRKSSPTFKRWCGVNLSKKNGCGIYIPKGFAHGFACLEEDSIVLYIANEKYYSKHDRGVLYSDPELGIKWPGGKRHIVSVRDLGLPPLKHAKLFD